MYPRMTDGRRGPKNEPSQNKLMKIFKSHQERFDEEYKQKLFELGEKELAAEAMEKYIKTQGQAKINYLALNKKS